MSIINPIKNNAIIDRIIYTSRSGVDSTDEKPEAFSALLSEAINGLNSSAGLNASTAITGAHGSFMPMPSLNNTLEQAIMTASSTGESNDAMIALLMLMMMMQSSQGDGDMSMMMQMMASMIDQMQDKETIRNDFMFSSGGDPFTLDNIDDRIFRGSNYIRPTTEVTGTTKATLPLEWWRPAIPSITSSMEHRSPELYNEVVRQFNVEQAERYRPGRAGNTYCNIFVWDVTRAMGAEVPYYTDPKTGAPMYHPDTKGAKYMMARDMDKWLEKYGPQYGWHQVDAQTAQMHANMGKPAITSASDRSHVQVVIPSKDGQYDPVRGVAVAQAGSTNTNYMHISGIYGSSSLKNSIRYWIHE